MGLPGIIGALGASGRSVPRPVVDAGPDASHDMLGAAPCQLAGSATGDGPITYLWTRVSGPPVTFADATDPETTCEFAADDEPAVLDLAATNAGGTSHDQVTITVTAELSVLMARMATGSRVAAWWEVGESAEQTEPFGEADYVTQLNNVGAAAWHPTAVFANAPLKDVGAGPLGDDLLTYDSLSARLNSTAISIPGNKELFFAAGGKGVEVGANRVQCGFRVQGSEGGDNPFSCIDGPDGNYIDTIVPNGQAEHAVTVVTPEHSTEPYLKMTRYAAALSALTKINDISISPSHFEHDGRAATVESMSLGHATLAGGSTKFAGVFESVTALEEEAIAYYGRKRMARAAPTKLICYAGQSNPLQATLPAPPPGCAFARVAMGSSSIGSGPAGSPWPFGWGPADPNGWRARLAAEIVMHRRTLTSPPVICWWLGESDALGLSSTHYDDLTELIEDIAARTGRSDILWVIIRLNSAFAAYSADAATGTPLIRTAQTSVVADDTAHRALVNVDSLTPGEDGVAHYLTAQHATIFGWVKAAVATLTGDASWLE